jgi:hypothetical protein
VLRAAAVRLWSFWEAVRRGFVVLSVGAGAGAIVVWSRADIQEDALESGTRTGWTGAGYLGGSIQLALRLSKHVWLRTGFIAGASLPSIAVLYGGNEIAGFGLPMLEGFLGLELKIP